MPLRAPYRASPLLWRSPLFQVGIDGVWGIYISYDMEWDLHRVHVEKNMYRIVKSYVKHQSIKVNLFWMRIGV